MKLELLFLGKTREDFLARGIEEYAARLKHYVGVEVRILKDKTRKGESDDQRMQREADVLLRSLAGPGKLVALDRKGKGMASEMLSRILCDWEGDGVRSVSFVIGGPAGLHASVLQRADLVLSLSKMTFTHEISRLLLLEQLYRAYTIKAGESYHR